MSAWPGSSGDIWGEIDYFVPAEFRPHAERMCPVLLRRLDRMRRFYGAALYIASDFRLADPLSHGEGEGVDLTPNEEFDDDGNRRSYEERRIKGAQMWPLREAAERAGFIRIGIYDLHCHVDVSLDLPQYVLWTGVSS